MRFVALDVETANADMASICSIGAATYESGRLVSEWSSLIDPRGDFDPMNISIHGIDERRVAGAPTFKEAADALGPLLGGVVATLTSFDRLAKRQPQFADRTEGTLLAIELDHLEPKEP